MGRNTNREKSTTRTNTASLYIHLAGRVFDRNALSVCILNGPCIVKICYRTVPGNGPCGILVNINAAVSAAAIPRTAFVLNHGAFEAAALGHIQIQLTDAVPDNITIHLLGNCCKETICTVTSTGSPASLITVAGAFQESLLCLLHSPCHHHRQIRRPRLLHL